MILGSRPRPAPGTGGGFAWASLEEPGGPRELTKKQYDDLPLSQRIELVLQRKVKFYRHDGSEVSAAEAMRGI